MREMSREEWWAFASAGTRTGMLGLVRADGAPIVTPVWFVLHEGPDGDELIFNTGTNTLKAKRFGVTRASRWRSMISGRHSPMCSSQQRRG
ncbi:pyridoxamine 5'-phosphate oxidase family protein [Mycobacteroides abscessus subsp. bolletii 1513]|uniref:Pyridoxamine 5'-phosphate oxidase family protein n=1 Tax=Mycobacteroides abscessus subsp. bolletii 1513 TaxID=1299321 RepID=X8DVD7_9MYCO|nr:pyridoxamine 5'-phosphate oxidase family protein [Mycobacteroides abscessus subsp. bolletii 1513]